MLLSQTIYMNEKRDKKRLTSFGKHLKYYREEVACISQDQLAARCDVNKYKISLIENGKSDFMFTTLLELAKGLNIQPKQLLDFEIE